MSARAVPEFRYSWDGPPAHSKGWVTTLVANGYSDGGMQHSRALAACFKKLRMRVKFGSDGDEKADGFPMAARGTVSGLPMSVFVCMLGEGKQVLPRLFSCLTSYWLPCELKAACT